MLWLHMCNGFLLFAAMSPLVLQILLWQYEREQLQSLSPDSLAFKVHKRHMALGYGFSENEYSTNKDLPSMLKVIERQLGDILAQLAKFSSW